MFEFIGGGIHLGNHNGLVILVFLAELVVDGGELFAVSAPAMSPHEKTESKTQITSKTYQGA